MKTFMFRITTLALLTLGSLPAMAQVSGIWTDANKKTVTFAPVATLSVALTHVGADDTYWDQLDLEMSYDSGQIQSQIAGLKLQYPGFQINRAMTGAGPDFTLEIPALKLSEKLTPEPGVDGPFVRYQTFISKSQADGMRAALKADPGAVLLTASALAQVPELKILEHFELPESVCDDLVPPGANGFEVLKRMSAVFSRIESLGIKLPTTKDALKRSLLESCVELEVGTEGVTSFSELFSTPVRRVRGKKPLGETVSDVIATESYGIQFSVRRSIDGVGL